MSRLVGSARAAKIRDSWSSTSAPYSTNWLKSTYASPPSLSTIWLKKSGLGCCSRIGGAASTEVFLLVTRSMETDYLVVGAGAMGMAFTDALVDHADAHVTLVDRRHTAGGHWLDAYPFVQLHQAS